MERFFDVIIVGAGPAGSTAALKLAKAGLKVAMLERGTRPGSKNMFGGLLHNSPVLNELFPDFWNRAPLERHVYRKTLAIMTPKSSANLTFETEEYENTPYNGCTVMRPIFDSWLADEATKSGALLLCNCTVDNLIKKGNRIAGVMVKSRSGDLRSNIVIAADGVLSFMAEKAGLRKGIQSKHMGLGVKLLMGMPSDVINERFGLVKEEGADFSLLGVTGGIKGGGFLYTNIESISLGLVLHLDSLKASQNTPYDILNNALQQPQIKKLVKGAVPLEYSAHLIPEGGTKGMPKIFTDGMMVVGDAAGLCYTNGINLEGINLAMTSGSLAADTAFEAIEARDYSAQMLSNYKKRLDESFVLRDMRTFKAAVDMMQIERLYHEYPEFVCCIFEKIYNANGLPRDKILKLIRKEMTGKIKMKDLISDGFKIRRALL